jgi:hypothetical protein
VSPVSHYLWLMRTTFFIIPLACRGYWRRS